MATNFTGGFNDYWNNNTALPLGLPVSVPSISSVIGGLPFSPQAQTPGGAPNPVAAAAGLNWPSPGAAGIAPGTTNSALASALGFSSSDASDWFQRGAVFLIGLVFIGGGVSLFKR